MAYTLRFIFSGLCMFVPDRRDAANPKMHVLLPDTRLHTHHGIDPHFVQLFYDQGRQRRGQPKRGIPVPFSMEDQELVVPALGAGIDLRLPPQIVNLSHPDFTGQNVPASMVDGMTPGRVWARITLQSGRVEICRPGARWQLGDRHVCLTHHVVWRIDVTDASESIDFSLRALNGAVADDIRELHRSVPTNEIEVEIYNARVTDLPTSSGSGGSHHSPGPGYQADHFTVFYELVGSSSLGPPELVSDVGTCPAGEEENRLLSSAGRGNGAGADHEAWNQAVVAGFGRKGVDPYRCMVASGELG